MTNTSTEPRWHKESYECGEMKPSVIYNYTKIVSLYCSAAFGRDRLIRLLTFVWRILTANLIRICHPRRLWNDKKKRRKKYCKPCENQRRHFTPFVVSTDGMFGFEARAFLKRLAKLLAEEWEKPYSTVMGFINARMSIALVRTTNRCIRGSRIPASNMSNRFRWEGGAGLGLMKSDNMFETLHVK